MAVNVFYRANELKESKRCAGGTIDIGLRESERERAARSSLCSAARAAPTRAKIKQSDIIATVCGVQQYGKRPTSKLANLIKTVRRCMIDVRMLYSSAFRGATQSSYIGLFHEVRPNWMTTQL